MKNYAIFLPDIPILSSMHIFYVLNLKKIRIYTTKIYNGIYCIGNNQLENLLYDIKCGKIDILIIYKRKFISYKHLFVIKKICKKNICKIIYIE